MRALLDGDIFRYEVGFGAETAWKQMTGKDELPSFDFVRDFLEARIAYICSEAKADCHTIYISEGKCFRYDIAKTVPYKGNRPSNKPWHYDNLTVHMKYVLGATVVEHLEADDAMAIDHMEDEDTIICSRDKDLRQVPGWFYSWEMPNSNQPAFGPVQIKDPGHVELNRGKQVKCTGTGYAFFCAQVLMGDRVDAIPGLEGWGPVRTFKYLDTSADITKEAYDLLVEAAYEDTLGSDYKEYLAEQRNLCWLVRELDKEGLPVLWQP